MWHLCLHTVEILLFYRCFGLFWGTSLTLAAQRDIDPFFGIRNSRLHPYWIHGLIVITLLWSSIWRSIFLFKVHFNMNSNLMFIESRSPQSLIHKSTWSLGSFTFDVGSTMDHHIVHNVMLYQFIGSKVVITSIT